MLICFPEVNRGIAVQHTFLTIDDKILLLLLYL